jgi:hypothetical protein
VHYAVSEGDSGYKEEEDDEERGRLAVGKKSESFSLVWIRISLWFSKGERR